jgi:hypothetical protein
VREGCFDRFAFEIAQQHVVVAAYGQRLGGKRGGAPRGAAASRWFELRLSPQRRPRYPEEPRAGGRAQSREPKRQVPGVIIG